MNKFKGSVLARLASVASVAAVLAFLAIGCYNEDACKRCDQSYKDCLNKAKSNSAMMDCYEEADDCFKKYNCYR
jgi:hypothetical protein